MRYASLAQRIRAHIGQEHRFAHTVRVARCADVLAQHHRLDAAKARLAGMLHDLARLYSPQRLITECEDRQMPLDEFDRANPVVLHARLGAAVAREAFGVHDKDVLSAIEKHTTAAAEMSPLDCVLYLADGLEPGREFDERTRLWEIALRDLRQATRLVIASSLRYLQRREIPIAPQTHAAAAAFGVNVEEVRASAS